MGWFDDISKGLTNLAVDIALPNYPEDGTKEEVAEYYDDLISTANKGADILSMLGIDALGHSSKEVASSFDHGDELQRDLVGDPEMMLHYFSGSGEDVPLYENQQDIDNYIQEFHDTFGQNPQEWEIADIYKNPKESGRSYMKNIWYESRNPEYPAEDGWEFLSYNPTKILDRYTQEDNDPYNLLGTGSTMRRRFDYGTNEFEYQVVEDWDVLRGESDWEDLYDTVLDYGKIHGVREYDWDIISDDGDKVVFGDNPGYKKIKDFDVNNFTIEEFNLVLDDLIQEEDVGSMWGGVFSELPYIESRRVVNPYIAEKALEYAPNFFRQGNKPNELIFSPDYHGIQFLMNTPEAYDVTGTSIISGEDWLFGE